jgi:hypothetical protein
MDTLHFEPQSFHSRRVRHLFGDDRARRIDDTNVSEPEVFMMRGRRLQVQAIGDVLRDVLAKLHRLLRRSHHDAGAPRHAGRHRHA